MRRAHPIKKELITGASKICQILLIKRTFKINPYLEYQFKPCPHLAQQHTSQPQLAVERILKQLGFACLFLFYVGVLFCFCFTWVFLKNDLKGS